MTNSPIPKPPTRGVSLFGLIVVFAFGAVLLVQAPKVAAVIIAALVLYSMFRPRSSDKPFPIPTAADHRDPPAERRPTVAGPVHWTNDGNFEFDVVGESHYQRAISQLHSQHQDREFVVQLVPEENEHDSSAIAVYGDGMKVGHLSREDARSFRRRLGAKKLSGQTTTCPAVITGGFEKDDGTRAMFGIQLDMKPFE